MANTDILIKRSLSTGVPGSLKAGELAYSYASNTIFIGTPSGDGVVNIGGQYYTSTLDSATSANTGSTLVKRDANGQFSGRLDGIANSADQLTNIRTFSVSGGDITATAENFDGTGNVTLNASLNVVPSLGAGTYGSQTEIPVIQVAANGRVMNVTTSTISTTLSTAGDSGTGSVNLLNDTLNFVGADGITSSASGNTVTFDVDNTVIRTLASVGPQTIDTDLTITGNVNITGNIISHGANDLIINDPIILLANNNTADVIDIGFVGHYVESGNTLHTGLVRHAATDTFYLFKDYLPHIQETNILNIADPTLVISSLAANLISKSSEIDTITSSTGTVTIDDILTVTGVTTITNDLSVTGNLAITGTTNFTGAITANTVTANTVSINDTLTVTNGITSTNGNITSGGKILAAQGVGSNGGFSFTGTEGGNDSGMFSNADGNVHFYADNTDIAYFTPSKFEISKPTYITGLNKAATLNVVYFNATTGELTYDVDNNLTPAQIANGAYSLSISSVDGLLTTNGSGLQLANGAIIKDTAGDAVAFGQNAGTLNQGIQAVAIGDSAGYNAQGAYGVAIGYGAGNVNQGQTAVAIGINAGISNQGNYGIAIGNSAGGSQGQYSIALGYDSGQSSGADSVAIGTQAGKGNTSPIGANSITIGKFAGFESAAADSIILNASGSNLSSATSGFFVNPVRYSTSTNESNDLGLALYNQSTKEFKYTYALDGGSF